MGRKGRVGGYEVWPFGLGRLRGVWRLPLGLLGTFSCEFHMIIVAESSLDVGHGARGQGIRGW